jgi:hypothetical protein
MNYETTKAFVTQASDQFRTSLYLQSVGFFTPRGEGAPFLSSGTLVSICDRLFICTASHCVSRTDDHVWVLSGEPTISTDPHILIVNKGYYLDDNDPDVGFLELGTDDATEFLKKEACPVDRLAIRGIGRPFRPTILIGCPDAYLKREEQNGCVSFLPQTFGYIVVPKPANEWHTVINPDPRKHIILDYPDTSGERTDNGQQAHLPIPVGMSGGGLWDHGFEDNVIWTSDSARLIGIQSSWHPTLRYAKAIQIVHWLRLIHANYPDLRPTLEAQFGQLSTE